jgi:YqaJ-like viral recombinase domain
MPIFYHDVPQYSEEYDRLKLGIPTSSHFHKIITPQGKPSKQWREYACLLIAERLLQRKIEFYNSPAMERGLIVETEAADWCEFDQDVMVQRVGFITDENHTVGRSPDRLVGGEGLLEIKAPLPHTQVEYWISGELNERFRPQLQGQLYISQRSWVDILCWHDVLPKVVMRVEPDAQFIKTLDRELQIFNFFIERVMEKIRATYEILVPQGGSALKAALRASLDIVP